jgi:hypothetical protein
MKMAAIGGLIAKGASMLPKILPIASSIFSGIKGIFGGGDKQQPQQIQHQGGYDMGQRIGQMPYLGREMVDRGRGMIDDVRGAWGRGDYGGAIDQGIGGIRDMYNQGRNMFYRGRDIVRGGRQLINQFRGGW